VTCDAESEDTKPVKGRPHRNADPISRACLANLGEATPPTTGATACSQFVQDFADNTD